MTDPKEIIKAELNIILDPVLELIQNDPHQWSNRPCSTCQAISSIIGKPFGCKKVEEEKKAEFYLDGEWSRHIE